MRASSRTRIDPRMADRREGVRKARRRTVVRLLAVPALLGAVAAAVIGVIRSPLLDVDRIQVAGAERTPIPDVVEAAGVERGDQMVDLDPQEAEEDVAALPWIDEARVVRDWPSTVRIEVSERVAVAVVERASGGLVLVDEAGRLLEDTEDPGGLVLLEGVGAGTEPGSRLEAPEAVLEVAAAIGPGLEEAVAAVVWQDGEAMLRLRPEGMARLGGVEDLEAKLRAVETVWAQVDTRCLAVIDVRVPTAPVVTRSGECAPALPESPTTSP